jgi:hypothetical protein
LAFTARSASKAHASTVKAKMQQNQRVFGHFGRGGEKCGLGIGEKYRRSIGAFLQRIPLIFEEGAIRSFLIKAGIDRYENTVWGRYKTQLPE